MNIVEEFRNHARQCRQMARSAGDHETRAAWSRMAERWSKLAEERETAERETRTEHERKWRKPDRYERLHAHR